MKTNIVSLGAVFAMAVSHNLFAGEIEVQIAPSNVNFASQIHQLTVHTDIPYKMVNRETLELLLQGVGFMEIDSIGTDAQGNLMAQYVWDVSTLSAEDKARLLGEGEANFQLSGYTIDPNPFEGEDDVKVVEVPAP